MSRTPTAAICFSLFFAAPLATAQTPECSIRPARGTGQADLRSLVKISSKEAEGRAVASVAPDKVNAIMSSEVEVVNGCLAYPFDLRFANKGGVQEVMVDAGDGKILSSEYEPPAAGTSGGPAPVTPAPNASATPEATPPAALPPGAIPVTDAVAAAEEVSIRKVIDAEEDAWNRGDAKAFAARFQEDGAFTDVFGAVSHTRAELEKRQVDFFTSLFKGSRLALKVRKVRFLRPDVAIVEIDTEISGFRKLPPVVYVDVEKVLRTRLQQVMAKTGTDWMVAAFHNVDVKTAPEKLVDPEGPTARRSRSRR
jgi:uncharacterized protein (TIGR02246 family)